MSEQLNIIINATNNTDPAFQGVQKNLQNLGIWVSKGGQETFQAVTATQSMTAANKEAINPLATMALMWGKVMGVMAGVTVATIAAKKVIDFAEEGAAISGLKTSTANLAASYGVSMNDVVTSLKNASQGTISEMGAMQAAGNHMMLGLGSDVDKMSNLMEIAMFRGKAMGLSTEQAFSDIVRGIGRMSPLILDNLGIMIDADNTFKSYAASIGKTSEELSNLEKRQALYNSVLENGNAMLAKQGGLMFDTSTAYQRAGAEFKDFFNTIKEGVAYGFLPWIASSKEVTSIQEGRADQAAKGMIGNYKDYTSALKSAATAQGLWIDSAGNLVKHIVSSDYATKGATQSTDELVKSNYVLSEAQFDASQKYGVVIRNMAELNAWDNKRIETLDTLASETKDYVNVMALQIALQGDLNKLQEDYDKGVIKAGSDVGALDEAYTKLTKGVKEWVFAMTAGQLDMEKHGKLVFDMALEFGQMTQDEYQAAEATLALNDALNSGMITYSEYIRYAKSITDYNSQIMAGGSANYNVYYDIWIRTHGGSWGSINGSISDLINKGNAGKNPGGANLYKGLQYGGAVQAGQAYIVGEKRPEVLIMGSNGGGSIRPTTSGFNSGSPVTIHFTYAPVVSTATRQEALDVLAPVIEDVIKDRLGARIL